MEFKIGEEIYFRLLPDMNLYSASVIEYNNKSIILKLRKEQPAVIKKGSNIILTNNEMDYRADVEYFDSGVLKAVFLWNEKREYFRVDDFLQLLAKKVKDNGLCIRSRIFSGYGINISDELTPDETINPVLWKMLVDIQAKLALILERFNPDSESLLKVESKSVNISAAGICFTMDEKVEKGDLVEVKMFLPDIHPVGITTYGRVVRAIDDGCGQYKVALSFKDIEDDIRDEIVQYTLRRQRDIMKRQRNNKEQDV